MNIGRAIKEIRSAKDISQAEIEKRSGIRREYLSKIESGELNNLTLRTLWKIARALGVQVSVLIAQTEENGSEADIAITMEELHKSRNIWFEKGMKHGCAVAIAAIKAIGKR
jgi:transcriptional regulator with XRE-family HTH domain